MLRELKNEYKKLDKLLTKLRNKIKSSQSIQKARLEKKQKVITEKIIWIKEEIRELEKNTPQKLDLSYKDFRKLDVAGQTKMRPDGTLPNMDKYLSELNSTTFSGTN